MSNWRHKIIRTLSGAAREQSSGVRAFTAQGVSKHKQRRKLRSLQMQRNEKERVRTEKKAETARAKEAKRNAAKAERYYRDQRKYGHNFNDPIPF